MYKTSQKGQVLLIVVLIMVIALTIGLSLAARSITNLKIATDDENSQRAFSAAEAAVEKLLKSDCSSQCDLSSQPLGNNASFTGTATQIQGGSFLVKGGVDIKQDEGVDVWLSNYSTDPTIVYGGRQTGRVTVYWGDTTGDCTNAAMDIIVLYGSKVNPQQARYPVDPCAARRSQNQFAAPLGGATVASKAFAYSYPVDVANGLIMKVVPLYFNTTMAVAGTNGLTLPVQGKQIEAAGTAGGTVRRISFVQNFPSVPTEYFQYSLISP